MEYEVWFNIIDIADKTLPWNVVINVHISYHIQVCFYKISETVLFLTRGLAHIVLNSLAR